MSRRTQPSSQLFTKFPYVDVDGSKLFFVGNDERRRIYESFGDGDKPVDSPKRLVPFRLPELIRASSSKTTIVICDNETDVDKLLAGGLSSTCFPPGPLLWADAYKVLANYQRIVFAADQSRFQAIATELQKYGVELCWTEHSVDELLILDEAQWTCKSFKVSAFRRSAARFAPKLLKDVQEEPVEWLLPGYIPVGFITMLYGEPGIGKSTIAISMLASLTQGRCLFTGTALRRQYNVLYATAEDSLSMTVKRRAQQAEHDDARFFAAEFSRGIISPQELERVIIESRIDCVVIDPLIEVASGTRNANAANDVRALLSPYIEVAARTGASIIFVGHSPKNAGPSSKSKLYGSVDFMAAARNACSA
jgi:hypothetical protein